MHAHRYPDGDLSGRRAVSCSLPVRLNHGCAFPPRQLVEHNLSPVDAQWMQIIALPLVSRSLGAGVRETPRAGLGSLQVMAPTSAKPAALITQNA